MAGVFFGSDDPLGLSRFNQPAPGTPSPDPFKPMPMPQVGATSSSGIDEELIDSLMESAGLTEWERRAMAARKALRQSENPEEARALYDEAYSNPPSPSSFEEWQSDLKFKEERLARLRERVSKDAAVGAMDEETRAQLEIWLGQQAESLSQERGVYTEQLSNARTRATEERSLKDPRASRGGFWGSWLGRKMEDSADWVLDVIQTPVNIVSAAAWSIGKNANFWYDQARAAFLSGDARLKVLQESADYMRDYEEAWSKGGGWAGIMGEVIPFMDDKDSVIDRMASNMRKDVGEAYDSAYAILDHETNGALTGMNEHQSNALGLGKWGYLIPVLASYKVALGSPSLPKNMAEGSVSVMETLLGADFSPKERSEMVRQVSKEMAGGLLEMTYDPTNLLGGPLTKAGRVAQLAKVADEGAQVLARARVLGLVKPVKAAEEGAEVLSKVAPVTSVEGDVLKRVLGANYETLGKWSEYARARIAGGEDIQLMLSKLRHKEAVSTADPLFQEAKALGKGRVRVFEAGGQYFDNLEDAAEYAGVSKQRIKWADLKKADASALFSGEAEASRKLKKSFRMMQYIPDTPGLGHDVLSAAARGPRVAAEDAAAAGRAFDALVKVEMDEIAKLSPQEYVRQLIAARGALKLPYGGSKGPGAQILRTLESQIQAARELSKLTERAGAFRLGASVSERIERGQNAYMSGLEKVLNVMPGGTVSESIAKRGAIGTVMEGASAEVAKEALRNIKAALPGKIWKASVMQKAQWAMELAEAAGDKIYQMKVPQLVHRLLVSRIPSRFHRPMLAAEAAANADKAELRQFSREFVEQWMKRLERYRFTPDQADAKAAEELAESATKVEEIAKAAGQGIPSPSSKAPLPASRRALTEVERDELMSTIRDMVEAVPAANRGTVKQLLRHLGRTKAGREMMEALGPHAELAVELSHTWDEGAEFLKLFQQRKGLRLTELVDDVVEGWFGRVWSSEMMEILLTNGEVRKFVQNFKRNNIDSITSNLALPRYGQFARRAAREVLAKDLEKALRKKFSIPENIKILETDPTKVIERNAQVAEIALQKRHMLEAFGQAAAPVDVENLSKLMGAVTAAEAARYENFVKGLVKRGDLAGTAEGASNRVHWKALQDVLLREPLGSRPTGGPASSPASRAAVILEHEMDANRALQEWRETVKVTKGSPRYQAFIKHAARYGFDLASVDPNSEAGKGVFMNFFNTLKRSRDLEAIHDTMLLDKLMIDELVTLAGATRLDTPEGRMLNIWITPRGVQEVDYFASGGITGRVSGRKRPVGASDSFIMITPTDPGDINWTVMHEVGHLVDWRGVMPEKWLDDFFNEWVQYTKPILGGGKRSKETYAIQKLIAQKIYGENLERLREAGRLKRGTKLKDPVLFGEEHYYHGRETLLTPEQEQRVGELVKTFFKQGVIMPYRLKPQESFADTMALALQGIFDPRFPTFSKKLLLTIEGARANGTNIFEQFTKMAERTLRGTWRQRGLARDVADVAGDLGKSLNTLASQSPAAAMDSFKLLLQEAAQGGGRVQMSDVRSIVSELGGNFQGLMNLKPEQRIRYIEKLMADAGMSPRPDQTSLLRVMMEQNAALPESLEETLKVASQHVDNSDIRILNELMEGPRTKGPIEKGIESLQRFFQKSVLALPSGVVKDLTGSMLWYWVHAKNPLRSAARAAALLTEKSSMLRSLRTGASVWRNDAVLDPLKMAGGLTTRTEVEAGRLADLVTAGGALGKLEQRGMLGTALQVAGNPRVMGLAAGALAGGGAGGAVDQEGAGAVVGGVVGAMAGPKLGKQLMQMLSNRTGGRGVRWLQREVANWSTRGRQIGEITDIPINIRKFQDEFWRVSLYLDRLEAGYNPNTATREVFRAFGNMNELTKFEERFIKKAFFFYTWMRKALPASYRAFLDHPIKSRMLYLATIGDVGSDEENNWPSWLKQMGGFHIGKDSAGNPAVVNVLPGSWFAPMRDFSPGRIMRGMETEGWKGATFGSAQAALRNMMPMWKVPVELMSGVDTFTGLPIHDANFPERTADKAPPILASPWVPQSIKDLLGVRPRYDKRTGQLMDYRMDPALRFLLLKSLPGTEGGLQALSSLTLSDERKTIEQQYSRLWGMPVYSVPEQRDSVLIKRTAFKGLDIIRREIEALDGHPVSMEFGRPKFDEGSAAGRQMKLAAEIFAENYLNEKTARAQQEVQTQTRRMLMLETQKRGGALPVWRQVQVERAVRNSLLPSMTEQEAIKREGVSLYLQQKAPKLHALWELAERFAYWTVDPSQRKDYSVPNYRPRSTVSELQKIGRKLSE